MQWENLTSLDFEIAVTTCNGVGVLPIGVIEPHGPHLPLGTDMFEAHAVACRAAKLEPAIVFPAYPYGINHESAHLPGSVTLRRNLVLDLLENICDEMARHGLTRIILFSGHGGNRFMIPLFVQTLVEKAKDYVVYDAQVATPASARAVLETQETGHACEFETSVLLYLHPDLVKMDQVPPAPFTKLHRAEALQEVGVYGTMDWYAAYPHMYVGDASLATADKGQALLEPRIAGLAEIIRRVKADTMTPALQREFLDRMCHPASPDFWTKKP